MIAALQAARFVHILFWALWLTASFAGMATAVALRRAPAGAGRQALYDLWSKLGRIVELPAGVGAVLSGFALLYALLAPLGGLAGAATPAMRHVLVKLGLGVIALGLNLVTAGMRVRAGELLSEDAALQPLLRRYAMLHGIWSLVFPANIALAVFV